MKVAVTAQGETLASETDPRFGRARCFVVVDTESGTVQAVDNSQNLNSAQGAGIQAAQTVARLEVEAVVTGNCGPRAFRALDAAGIRIYLGAEGTVQQSLDKLDAGQLQQADSHNVEGHW
jgi:predicted Fe-Mo cluster-binding NifX family protein